MNMRAKIHITGIVQGVGFRPFIYREATALSLVGFVLNLGDAGVKIIVEGKKDQILELLKNIKNNPPPIALIEGINVEWSSATNEFSNFSIRGSKLEELSKTGPHIPPDIAICEECIKDIFSESSRWYLYPFTSCTKCGPRYSTITDLPYDRPNTTMVDFPLCNNCNKGYTNPSDRRYHAQTTACPKCGPRYTLFNKNGEKIVTDNPIREAAHLIDKGKIIAIHGIAGTHLFVKTSDSEPIKELRKRKRRRSRPFAIMVKNKEIIKKIVKINELELETLTSWRRPIILLPILDVLNVIPKESVDEIAPGLNSLGVMLPFSGIHYLLFRYLEEKAVIATSANPSGIPMYITPSKILQNLREVADFFLVHNRRIAQRVDDTVIKFLETGPMFVRRSRGYVPEPIDIEGIDKNVKIIAVGPEEKATGAILKSQRVYLTQHIGDTNRIENIMFLEKAIRHLCKLTRTTQIQGIACDLHPEFLSTNLAEKLSKQYKIELFKVQHHHAHLAAVAAENQIGLNTNITCITIDGFGYGLDGTAWGGEILFGNVKKFKRVGGLDAHFLPGGDLSARYPVRSFIGILGPNIDNYALRTCQNTPIAPATKANSKIIELIRKSIIKRINTVKSSSAGRFLDAIAFALGICQENTYDGECPMKLEAISRKTDLKIEPEIRRCKINTSHFLNEILELKKQKKSIPEIAYAAQWYLGTALAEVACDIASKYGTRFVGISGGVAINRIITKAIVDFVTSANLQPLIHRLVPPGDGGIALGQIAVAASRVLSNEIQ